MKRIGNLYEQIISLDNLRLAEKKARKGKSKQYGVIKFSKNNEKSLASLYGWVKHCNGINLTNKYINK